MEKVIMNKKLLLALSIFMLLYWLFCRIVNVYKYVVLGVISEILWFPMVVLLFVVPIINVYLVIKNKNNVINYINLLLNLMTIFFLFII